MARLDGWASEPDGSLSLQPWSYRWAHTQGPVLNRCWGSNSSSHVGVQSTLPTGTSSQSDNKSRLLVWPDGQQKCRSLKSTLETNAATSKCSQRLYTGDNQAERALSLQGSKAMAPFSEQLQGSGVDQVGFHNQWAFGSAPATCRTLLYTPGGKATNDDALDPGDPLSILEQVFVPCGREVLLLSLWQSSQTHTDFGEGRPQSHSRVEVAHRKPIS